jgi:glycoside/pentoside/hexuronide:cation symporter, GPH family
MSETPAPGTGGLGGTWRNGACYGALGLPLAFVALPLYVVLPNHYATQLGVPLAWLGLVLLAARLLDAAADPLIGSFVDRWLARSPLHALRASAVCAGVLAAGFTALFSPPVQGLAALLAWCAAFLAVTYLSYSVVAVVHQAWGARLGGNAAQRTTVVAWREGLGLIGVLVASVLPALAGLGTTALVFAGLLWLGMTLFWHAPRPKPAAAGAEAEGLISPPPRPLANPVFVKLLMVYLLNGIASAVPATLVLFFIRDRLQAPEFEPLFLASYFAAAACSTPLWVRAVSRWGLAPTWLAAMLLGVAMFMGSVALGPGEVAGFVAVCVLSGLALGADLTIPGAMLAGLIQRAGHAAQAEGTYFGWWNFATKFNLALAAGVSLPALQWWGYAPGSRTAQALAALTLAYCVLPCVLKLAAAGLLYRLFIQPTESST